MKDKTVGFTGEKRDGSDSREAAVRRGIRNSGYIQIETGAHSQEIEGLIIGREQQ